MHAFMKLYQTVLIFDGFIQFTVIDTCFTWTMTVIQDMDQKTIIGLYMINILGAEVIEVNVLFEITSFNLKMQILFRHWQIGCVRLHH